MTNPDAEKDPDELPGEGQTIAASDASVVRIRTEKSSRSVHVEVEAILPRPEANRLKKRHSDVVEMREHLPDGTPVELGVWCADCAATRGALKDLRRLLEGGELEGTNVARSSAIRKLLTVLAEMWD